MMISRISSIMEEFPLPEGIRWLEVPEPLMSAGQTLFPVYSADGGFKTKAMSYLMKESPNESLKVSPVEFTMFDTDEEAISKIQTALDLLGVA